MYQVRGSWILSRTSEEAHGEENDQEALEIKLLWRNI